jgi:hypothetical protein
MEIQKGLELPKHGGGFRKYPWEGMQIGDSFLISDKSITSVSSVANRASARLGMKFSCRSTDAGVRVWRVS